MNAPLVAALALIFILLASILYTGPRILFIHIAFLRGPNLQDQSILCQNAAEWWSNVTVSVKKHP